MIAVSRDFEKEDRWLLSWCSSKGWLIRREEFVEFYSNIFVLKSLI
jgi:hypothetical protein